ncbi:MAG TPA: cysteine desulfurase family protein [Microvirga sp.]|jgi:cysteine desulfurase|nr:cysteine desulfurase family protein [Microvirga sp.]
MPAGERSYLDHNATSPLRPEAAEAMARALALPGNASSVHAEGRAARAVIEAARERVAALVGAAAKQVIFTSGGTEAANTVLSPAFRRAGEAGGDLLLAGAAEHPCILDGHRYPPAALERIPVGADGTVDLAWLAARLERTEGRALVSVQAANNETGILQPVAAAAALARARGGLAHTDAVQAAGRVPLDMAALGVDALTLSAHKLGGPKGVGAIVLASERLEIADRLVRGGGQERGYRAGTENVAAIAGFGAAAAAVGLRLAEEGARIAALRDAAEAALRRIAPDAVVFGAGAPRLPNTFAFAVPGLRAETALIAFDLAGVALSSGSACSSGKVKRSHVLQAMGVEPALAEGAIRVSLGWNSTEEDVFRFAKACESVLASLYRRRANAA